MCLNVIFVPMKKLLTYIVSFTALILFLVSSTGISFVIHHCFTAQTEHIQFFANTYKCETETEAVKLKPSCCCAKHAAAHEDKSLLHLGKSDCCKNTYQFLKMTYQYENTLTVIQQIVAHTPFISRLIAVSSNSIETLTHHQLYHPPPLQMFGKYLIHFIHNLKIPFPSYC